MTVMFGIGNTFGRRSAPAEKSQAENSGNCVGARLTLGRASKAYELKSGELADTSTKLAELDQVIGEKLADDLDATADIHERQRLHARVQQLEAATAVLRQRKDEAEASLKQAGQAAAVESTANALAKNKAVALRIDDAFQVLHQLAQEQAASWDAVCLIGGADVYGSYKTDAKLHFQLFLNLAAHPMTGKGFVSPAFMKFQKFSESAPT
jgi:hypothetical protein